MNPPSVTLIAAVARNGIIGADNAMPWRLPEDLAFLRRTTLDHVVIMGRKTWQSLPPRFRPLPQRRNIVVSRDPGWRGDGAEHATSLQAALTLAGNVDEVFVIGGAQLYAHALPAARRLLLTEIEQDFEGDAYFPAWECSAFVERWCTHHESAQGLRYRRRCLERNDGG